jgi:hypothetical protein
MSSLINHLSSDRIRGGRLLLAYTLGMVLGVALAAVLLAATT